MIENLTPQTQKGLSRLQHIIFYV